MQTQIKLPYAGTVAVKGGIRRSFLRQGWLLSSASLGPAPTMGMARVKALNALSGPKGEDQIGDVPNHS